MSDRYISCSNEGTWAFLAGAVVGGLVGAGVALLYAPASGEETRKKLRKEGEKFAKQAQKKVGPIVKDIQKEIGQIDDKIKAGLTKKGK